MTEPAGTPANAIRTTSKTGGAKDVKIQRFDQIPAGPLAELAARYGIGSLKYPQVNGLDNWRNGYPWSYSYRALVGHANAFWGGEDVDPAAYLGTDDPESLTAGGDPRPGVTHLAAVAWHAFALLHWAETHPEYDDRESTVLARHAAGLSATEESEDSPCQEPEICRGFAACSLECERRYAREDEYAGLDVQVNPNIPEGHIFIAPLPDAEEQVKLFTYPKTTVKPEELHDQGGWSDLGWSSGDLFSPPNGRPITFEETVGNVSRRIYIPNGEIEDKGDGKFKVTSHPSPAEQPQLELDDYVRIEDSTDLAFVGDQYATVVAVKRDGMAVRYDVRLTGCAYTLLDLKPSQLVKQ